MDFTLLDFLISCGSILLAGFLISEILERTKLLTTSENDPINSPLNVIIDSGIDCTNPDDKSESESVVEGSNRLPIDIETRRVAVIELCEPLKWHGYSSQPVAMTMTNDGSSIVVRSFWSRGVRPRIVGGPLKGSYHFNSIILNWGLTDDNGSQHTIDSMRYPLEMQLVHIKAEYDSLEDAIVSKNKESVAIVSFLFEKGDNDNSTLDPIITNLSRVTDANTKVYIPPFYLDTLFPLFESKFYSYNGSLAQPPYSEIVTWIIQSKLLGVSSFQMAQFRKVHSCGPIINNPRPKLLLNDRDIYFHELN
ncbi:carbonic anhydrase 1-like [Microplitis mediator]|uniref:carbonic anhydrase 1-like n=1 Tax=Microplitis mediator TaxID=375433 RepID=UPI002555BB5D|nr:carbonic anhydrase 1-like [Microplitis mediator]